jgi:repressor LexA
MSELNKHIGEEIKRRRKEKGLSQVQFGELIGTIQANVSLLEQGKLNPSVGYLEKVAKALGIRVKDLL